MNYIKKYVKKQTTVIVLSIILLAIIAISTSYALFSVQDKTDYIVQVGSFKVTYTGGNIINFGSQIGESYCDEEANKNSPECVGILPQRDEKGKNQEGYNFTIENDDTQSTLPARYKVFIDTKEDYFNGTCTQDNPNYNEEQCNVLTNNLVPLKYIKFELTKNNDVIKEGTLQCLTFEDVANNNILPCLNNNILAEGVLDPGDEDKYNLKVWLIHYEEETAAGVLKTLPPNDLIGKEIHLEISVESVVDMDAIAVDIVDNMIPVSWDGSTLIKADKTNTNNNWYDYDNQKWANAVLVTDESRENYKTSNQGTLIIEDDILAYYTYIPRYRYQLWNANNNVNCLNDNCNEQEIMVEFENMTTPKSNGSQNGEWLTHPAFTFGESELNGLWVGKFTTSVDPTSTCYTTPNETNCNNKNHAPRVKPNLDMWRYIRVSTMFSVSKQIKTNSMYGLNSYENSDSHIMKNMEWGAVAYLSHSKYGKYGNENYSGENKELYINNYQRVEAEAYKTGTGCSGGTPNIVQYNSLCLYSYPEQTLEATGASTTGNIFGIYDMSGGSYEVVMGQIVQEGTELGKFYSSPSSGTWDEVPELKYYDSYEYDTFQLTHGRGHLGDATRETLKVLGSTKGGWYGDTSRFPFDDTRVWFYRGGYVGDSVVAGAFAFGDSGGSVWHAISFRIVLTLE